MKFVRILLVTILKFNRPQLHVIVERHSSSLEKYLKHYLNKILLNKNFKIYYEVQRKSIQKIFHRKNEISAIKKIKKLRKS